MTLDGGVNHLCLPIALNNSGILEKKTNNTFKIASRNVLWPEAGLKIALTFSVATVSYLASMFGRTLRNMSRKVT